jgi:hypothetical protein
MKNNFSQVITCLVHKFDISVINDSRIEEFKDRLRPSLLATISRRISYAKP